VPRGFHNLNVAEGSLPIQLGLAHASVINVDNVIATVDRVWRYY